MIQFYEGVKVHTENWKVYIILKIQVGSTDLTTLVAQNFQNQQLKVTFRPGKATETVRWY